MFTFRKLIRKATGTNNIDSILSAFTKAIADLRELADEQTDAAANLEKKAEDLRLAAAAHDAEAADAVEVALAARSKAVQIEKLIS
jgi:hypothetical protein